MPPPREPRVPKKLRREPEFVQLVDAALDMLYDRHYYLRRDVLKVTGRLIYAAQYEEWDWWKHVEDAVWERLGGKLARRH